MRVAEDALAVNAYAVQTLREVAAGLADLHAPIARDLQGLLGTGSGGDHHDRAATG